MSNSSLEIPQRVKNYKGDIFKLLKKDNFQNQNIFESYISKVNFNKIKAWKYHKKISLNLIVVRGRVLFITLENNKFNRYILDDKKFKKLFVPNKVWYGFMGLEKKSSTILSFANAYYSNSEILRKNIKDFSFDWSKYK